MKKFWKVINGVDSSGLELYIDGPISSELWWGDEATPQALRDELKKINSNKVTVVLNSGGGDVWAGLAMYNALRELDAEVTIRVDGLAASIASVIAMAGDKIIMSPGSMMMVHRASAWAGGNAEDLEKVIEMLETVEESIVPIYADRTGLDRTKIQEMLNAETWMSAEEAVELGFADEVAKKTVLEPATNSFSGVLALSMSATQASIEAHMAEGEDNDSPDTTVAADEAAEDEADDVSEETEEAETIETEPKTEEVETETEEATAEVETNKVADEEDLKMTQEIAKAQVIEPANQAPVEVKPDMKAYLNTKKSVEDFANILAKNAGRTAQEVKSAWADHLAATMGVTNPEVLLPGSVVRSIQDAFEQGGQIWSLVNKTGLTVFRTALNTVTGEDSRAKGWDRELASGQKSEQVITLEDRTIRAQFIYKYITLNKEDVRENADTGALVSYVLSELPKRIVNELERAILIGDGRAPGSEFEITSFVSVVEDAVSGDGYATSYTPVGGDNFLKSIVKADALVKAEGARYLVTSREKLVDMKLSETTAGAPYFTFGADVAGSLGFAGILTPDWFDEATVDAVIFVPSAYSTVGDNTIEAFTNFVLKENKHEYLQEIYAGGALSRANSAVVIEAAS